MWAPGVNYSRGTRLAPLRVAVEGDELVIRIGCSRIDGNDCHPEIPELPITDPHEWGRDIANEMMRDRGDGATPLCLFMDEMIHEAISMGATGIDHKRLAEIRRANRIMAMKIRDFPAL